MSERKPDPAIKTVAYDPNWPMLYQAEKRRLLQALGDQVVRIEHVGSTSVPGLAAKPIIDIEITVRAIEPMAPYREPLEALGYHFQFDPEMPGLHFFGFPAERPRRYHLHLSQAGSPHMTRVLAVRDFLRAHPAVAADYARLKRSLTDARPGDRNYYISGKEDFMVALQRRALAWYTTRAGAGAESSG